MAMRSKAYRDRCRPTGVQGSDRNGYDSIPVRTDKGQAKVRYRLRTRTWRVRPAPVRCAIHVL